MTSYSIMKTVWKALGVFVAVMAAVLAVPMLTEQELADAWPGYAIAVIAAAVKAYQNYVKHHTDMGLPMKAILPFLVLPLLFAGCVSHMVEERSTIPPGTVIVTELPDGTKQTFTYAEAGEDSFIYGSLGAAYPLGKLDFLDSDMSYKWGPNEELKLGQAAQGMDNTGMSVLVPLLQSFLNSLQQAQAQANESGKSKDLLLEALLRRLEATPNIP